MFVFSDRDVKDAAGPRRRLAAKKACVVRQLDSHGGLALQTGYVCRGRERERYLLFPMHNGQVEHEERGRVLV